MKTTIKLLVVMLLGWRALAAEPLPAPSPYEGIWDSPSQDSNGTMPLGNGEIALNAWIDPSGDLRFYIARTDSWDDNGRLVKVGAVRIKVGDESAGCTTNAPSSNALGYEFVKNAKFGIFVHDTAGSAELSPGKTKPAAWDLDAKVDAFDVEAFADAVEGMGAQYVTVTSFHAAMYLLAPSKVMVDVGMPTHQAKRGLLGAEIRIQAACRRRAGCRLPASGMDRPGSTA